MKLGIPLIIVFSGVGVIVGFLLIVTFVYIVIKCKRQQTNYLRTYVSTKDETVRFIDKLREEEIQEQTNKQDAALLNVQFYLRSINQYIFKKELKDLGEIGDKFWYELQNKNTREPFLLTLLNKPTRLKFPFAKGNATILNNLFTSLKHPYILSTAKFDFLTNCNKVILIQPFCSQGSLKDIIYQSNPKSGWGTKYCRKGKPLSTAIIQLYGRQILEAMQFLEINDFPEHRNLHSGNVIIDNGVCKLSGHHNSFLGMKARAYSLIYKISKTRSTVDVLLFGHLLYEMIFGIELEIAIPNYEKLQRCKKKEKAMILEFVFSMNNGNIPSFQEIITNTFFTNVTLNVKTADCEKVTITEDLRFLISRLNRKKLRKHPDFNKSQPSAMSPQNIPELETRSEDTASSICTSESTPAANQLQKGIRVDPRIAQFASIAKIIKRSASADGPSIAAATSGPTDQRAASALRRSSCKPNTFASTSLPPPAPAPPVPPPQPPKSAVSSKTSYSKADAALLKDIRKGSRLKKAVTNDRSAPKV